MNETIERLIRATFQAPSGDNRQPWRLDIDAASRRMVLSVDEARDPSPMNFDQSMSRIAVGAALENLLQAAALLGVAVRQTAPPTGAAVAVEYGEPLQPATNDTLQTIFRRATNRRVFNGRSVPGEVL